MNVFKELKVGKKLYQELSEALKGNVTKSGAIGFVIDYPSIYQALLEGKLKLGVEDGKE